MKLKNITPNSFECGIGACPAVFETESGSLVIVGKQVSATSTEPSIAHRVAAHEAVIEIPRALLADVVSSRKG